METLSMTEQISFFLFILISSFTVAFAVDTLKPTESLGFGQTLVSSGQKYEAGFFIPPGSEPDKIYLGIWYYNLTDPSTVVWVANRDNPARNSSVALKLESDGSGQIFVMVQGVEVWASNKSASNVVSPFVQLLDTGNLVIRETDRAADDYVWQSFDYPTDTLLPYQKLGWTKKTGMDRRLTSWKSTTDPALGNYSLVLIRTGDPDLLVKGGTETLYRTGPYTGQGLSGVPAMKPTTGINFTLPKTSDEVYYMFELVNPSIRSRLTMGSDGTLYRYTWVPDDQSWNIFWYHPDIPCDKYMACGSYGVCSDKTSFGCACPHGFVPRDASAMSLHDEGLGCLRRTNLECRTDGFRVTRNMKLPMSGAATLDLGKTLEECKEECQKDCNCTAYANARVVSGVGRGCVMWTGDLLDMRTFEEGGQDLYIRLAAADLGTKKTKKVIIGACVSVVLTTTISATVAFFAWKAKHKPSATKTKNSSKRESGHDLKLSRKTTSKHSLYNKNTDELELPFYTFDAMVEVTNNFSEENKLGEGGFGSVFKGMLNGVREIAIKRLSKESIQGLEEFKNEVNLIAKLQHRNLVRLLGYCVDKEEKMLIYEYLRNRSLDFILFNKERCSDLDWQRRFNIICGVAKGLMYLHHDSRLRIIHRDLKASNILLDDDMNPKISDFGLARIFRGSETETNNTKRVVGTYGYMSPEYAMDSVFSIKSDVFSFGVLVLEIVTGKKNRAFCDSHHDLNLLGYVSSKNCGKKLKAWRMWEEGKSFEVVDPSIKGSYRLDEVLKCVQLGLLCVQSEPSERPTMSSIVLMLNNENVILPQPKLPGFYLGWRHEESETEVNESAGTVNQLTITTVDGR